MIKYCFNYWMDIQGYRVSSNEHKIAALTLKHPPNQSFERAVTNVLKKFKANAVLSLLKLIHQAS